MMIQFLQELPTPLMSEIRWFDFQHLKSRSPFTGGISGSRGLKAMRDMIRSRTMSRLSLGILFVLLEAVQVDWCNPHDSTKDRASSRRLLKSIVAKAIFGQHTERFQEITELFINSWPKLGFEIPEFDKAVPHIYYNPDTGKAALMQFMA